MKSRLPIVLLFTATFVALASTLHAEAPKKDPEKTRLRQRIVDLEDRLLVQARAHEVATRSAAGQIEALQRKLVATTKTRALLHAQVESARAESNHRQRLERLLDRTRPRAEVFRFQAQGKLSEGLAQFEALTGCETRLVGASGDQVLTLRAKGSATDLAYQIAANVRGDKGWTDFEVSTVYEFKSKTPPELR